MDEFNIDATRISIGGTSAGGNLAAVLVQRIYETYIHPYNVNNVNNINNINEYIQSNVTDTTTATTNTNTSTDRSIDTSTNNKPTRRHYPIKFNLLLVPVIHYGCTTPSCITNAHAVMLGTQEINWFHGMYSRKGGVGGARTGYMDGQHRYYNPLYFQHNTHTNTHTTHNTHTNTNTIANDDSNININLHPSVSFPPPTVVVTSLKDALHDDGYDYYQYLNEIAVTNELTYNYIGDGNRNRCNNNNNSSSSNSNIKHIELPSTHWAVYSQYGIDQYTKLFQEGVCNV